ETIRRKQKELLFPNVGTYYEEALPLESGRGMFVKDVEGREYLDFFAGILTVSVGHCHPAVTEAAIAQQRKLVHVSTLYPTVPQLQLAAHLVPLKPMAASPARKTSSPSSRPRPTARSLPSWRSRSWASADSSRRRRSTSRSPCRSRAMRAACSSPTRCRPRGAARAASGGASNSTA